jgi:hypothetical protein
MATQTLIPTTLTQTLSSALSGLYQTLTPTTRTDTVLSTITGTQSVPAAVTIYSRRTLAPRTGTRTARSTA